MRFVHYWGILVGFLVVFGLGVFGDAIAGVVALRLLARHVLLWVVAFRSLLAGFAG